MPALTIEQREALRAALSARAEVLKAGIAQALNPPGSESMALTDHREETDDDAIVDLENALDVANLQRSTQELKDNEAALARLDTTEFGECNECGADIPFARLQANPLATRCTACQTVFERTHAQAGRPTL